MFLSVVFAFERGISESNKDSKFECRSVNDFRSLLLVISNLVVERQYFCCVRM